LRLGAGHRRACFSFLFTCGKVVPHSLRLDVLRILHDDPFAGHFGIARTQEPQPRNYWFPSMSSFIDKYVSTCDIHAVFHVSLLDNKQSTIPDRAQDPPPPVVVDGELEWEVEEILDSKFRRRQMRMSLCHGSHKLRAARARD
jgi:hypothetical protein